MCNRGVLSTLPILFLLVGLTATATRAAVVIVEDNNIVDNMPGLTGSTTTGAQMGGIAVTAIFSGGLAETIAWAPTGIAAGGVIGTGWSLSQNGNTFLLPWVFSFTGVGADLGQLVSLALNGTPGLTVFDRTFGGLDGTGTSGPGRDFAFSGLSEFDVNVTYSHPVGIGGAAPVGDIFHVLTIAFGDGGPRTGIFSFLQDTDNHEPGVPVPEPGMLALLGLALIGIGVLRLRRFSH
jgi:hypothetical protein